MPDYRKKKFGKEKKPIKNTVKKERKREKEIIFEDDLLNGSSKIKVIKGKKVERQRKFRIFLTTVAFLIAANIILSLILPVNLIENVKNLSAVIGSGSFPVELNGLSTIDTKQNTSVFYILSDTGLTAYNRSGKEVYHRLCGYENPVMSVSETRVLVYDQGGNELSISNLKEVTNTYKSDDPIICAAVGRNGSYAVVTSSSEYASTVTVFNRKSKRLYTWNSAKEIINNVCVSADGKKIGVSTITTVNGRFSSHLYVLSFESADPVYTLDLKEKTVISLKASGRNLVVGADGGYVSFINLKKNSTVTLEKELDLSYYRSYGRKNLFVFNLSSNKSQNTVVITDSNGNKKGEFQINETISDIQLFGSHIYCISDTKTFIYDLDGTLVRTGECGYGCKRLAVTGTYSVAVITDTSMDEFDISKKEK